MSRLPFAAAWAAAMRIYDPANSAAKVAKVIGGYVEKNISNPDPTQKWSNTCAVRMSYILNQSGLIIPSIPGQTVSGADKRQYFFRVNNLITFLKLRWGQPQIVDYPPPGGGSLLGKKGVILFEISGWRDARGHATLFNGSTCYDHCYFNEPGVNYSTDRANFWSLQ
ncbi:MAG: type VI secretion system amidase effector protein Tae4 [Gammaproteobacteria bacterium]